MLQSFRHSISGNYFLVPLFLFAVLFFLTPLAEAETMSSANYKVQNDVINMGGGTSSSASYGANDTVGDFATGEDQTSTNYQGCAGYECFKGTPYISFSVQEGIAAPGASGANVDLGSLTPAAVATSDGATINSIFLTAEANAKSGVIVTVADASTGLFSTAATYTIASATTTLAAGFEGFGLCVFSATQSGQSPTALTKQAPYNDVACTKTTGHAVGGVSPSAASILASTGQLKGGSAEILVKSSISAAAPAAGDYTDTLTFIATGTF